MLVAVLAAAQPGAYSAVSPREQDEAFRDIAPDVERITSKGYVRMKTLSLPFALPVQIRRFVGTLH